MRNANPVLKSRGGNDGKEPSAGEPAFFAALAGRRRGSLALAGILVLAGLGAGLAGCGGKSSDTVTASAPASPAAKGPETFFPIRVGSATARIQLAVTPTEMEHGLMGRTDLGDDDGMIFVYRGPQRMSFWMRNTPTPLDIGFFDADGILREVYPLQAYDETPVASKGRALHYALEMKQGWYRSRGVRPGDRLDLAALDEALKARGLPGIRMPAETVDR
ncbi:hypothetical protein OpiT1DRAFT_02486 [Opitutaceae bacterium TAV1]|nr:hypothetical protein OpiT1DRAFT_02486 [Opitutaceae bacterium TAV1]